MWTDGEYRAFGCSENLFGDGAKQQLGQAGAAMSSEHDQINVVFLNGFVQLGHNITCFDHDFSRNAAEGIKKLVAVFFILRLRKFEVDRPSGGPGHRIYSGWPNVKDENVGLVMIGEPLHVKDGAHGGRRKVGGKKNVLKS